MNLIVYRIEFGNCGVVVATATSKRIHESGMILRRLRFTEMRISIGRMYRYHVLGPFDMWLDKNKYPNAGEVVKW